MPKSLKSEQGSCYLSIDRLPVYNWFKVFETQDLKHLIISGSASDEYLQNLWEKLFNEYISIFGLDDSFKNYFKHTKKMLELEVKYALTKKGSILFKLENEKLKYASLNPVKENSDNFMSIIASVENSINRSINEREISVLKFYTYIKQLENEPVKR